MSLQSNRPIFFLAPFIKQIDKKLKPTLSMITYFMNNLLKKQV